MAAKILVVDDDPNVQRLLQYTLKQEGYDVVVAADGAEGFRLWGAEAPDLILLDVNAAQARRLPGRDEDPDRGGQREPRPDHHAHGRARGRAEGPRAARRRRRLPDQAVPPGRAAGPDQEPARPLRAEGGAAGPAAARPDPRVLRRQGRRRHDDHRDQRGDRAPSRARSQGRADRRQPPVRRPPGVPRPRARSQEHRRRRVRAVDRRRPRPAGHGQARFGHRPAARAALARDRRARPARAPADHHRAAGRRCTTTR